MKHGVPNILTLVAYGDVPGEGQVTSSHLFTNDGRVREYRHTRLVFEEVGRPLIEFETTGEMVSVIADALKAHQAALETAKILYRNVTVDSILILPDGKGVLGDWDMSTPVDAPRPQPRILVGTYRFASAKLLLNPTNAVIPTLAEDLESFYYVLMTTMMVTMRLQSLQSRGVR
ncbi:hypothetical protein PM082_017840 [Marasmius tenuissimus]|nr:hypothetical protein PM082_017840 [Marasmius tenuissimus]